MTPRQAPRGEALIRIMARYVVRWFAREGVWKVQKNGVTVPNGVFQTKDPAKRRAAELGGPGDTVAFETKGGSVNRSFQNPRA